jgi:hypothetical protein
VLIAEYRHRAQGATSAKASVGKAGRTVSSEALAKEEGCGERKKVKKNEEPGTRNQEQKSK